MRFFEVPINAKIRFVMGGTPVTGVKIESGVVLVDKINSPGTIRHKIDPELNQDDFKIVNANVIS